jgi:dihydrofolate synthase/folylpolyglutamate synthase
VSGALLPTALRSRADLDALLAAATNYEERIPADAVARAFDLARMRALLAAVGDPQARTADGLPRVVHVAGSKGKGSVCRMVERILREEARGPVGLYTSPHLVDLTERVAVDGVPVSDVELVRAADRLLPHVRAVAGTPLAPTFFEILTAAAWLVFQERGCADVVLEVGLGGRLDATNVCEPAVTVVTTIEREHTRVLGDRIEQIAWEKAGILKAGVPAVTTTRELALEVVRARAREVGAPLCVVGEAVRVLSSRTGPTGPAGAPVTEVRVGFSDGEWRLALPLAGAHHGENAAAACAVARLLHVPERRVRRALAAVRLPGVLEPVRDDPPVIVDGAHTPSSALRTSEAVAACWPGRPVHLLLAAMEDKDVAGIVRALAPLAARAIATAVLSPRAAPAERLETLLRECGVPEVEMRPEAVAAIDEAARVAASRGATLLVTGSVYLAGMARQRLRR